MADPISVQCPHCKAKLKLKAAPPAGKKVGCPKCKKPFPVKAPPKKKESDDDFLDALDDLSEDDYEAPEDEDSQDEDEERPARSTIRSKSGGSTKKVGKGKKGRSKKSSAGPLLAIIGGSVLALALLGGLGYLLMNLTGGAKGIRSASGWYIAFLPSDADMYVTARPADIMASPLLASVKQNPQAQEGLAQMEKSLGFPLSEIEHIFGCTSMDPNLGNAAQPGGARPMGGNPAMGMGMPGMGMMPGAAGGNRSGLQEMVLVVRLKQPYGGKTLDQISQQYPPKSHHGVSYHVNPAPDGGAFFFCDERNYVITEPTWIERTIDRKGQAEDNALLAYLAKDQQFSMIAPLERLLQKKKSANPTSQELPAFVTMMPSPELQKLVQEVTALRFDLNMPGGIDLKATLTCKTDSVAQQFRAEATKALDGFKQQAQALAFVYPEIDGVLGSLKVNQSGVNMDVSFSVPSAAIDRLKQMAPQPPGVSSPGLGAPGQSPGAFPPGVPPTGAIPPGTPPVVAPPVTAPPQN